MSTEFEVYPGESKIPTFNEVLQLSNSYLKEFLNSIGVYTDVTIFVEMRACRAHEVVGIDLNDGAVWDENQHAWFKVMNEVGGCDSYYNQFDELSQEIWKEELQTNEKVKEFESIINSSLNLGYYWSFRRSAGQPCIINLAYGLIAASFAKLTSGYIYTDDGAWEYTKFPAMADDFLQWYFRPNLTSYDNDRKWAEECIADIILKYKGK